VVLQRRQLVDEAFVKNLVDFAGRPSTYSRQLLNPSVCGRDSYVHIGSGQFLYRMSRIFV